MGFPPVTLVLKSDGSSVTGTIGAGAGATGTEISEGKVAGDVISFKVQIPGGRTVLFSGTLKGDEIGFTREVRVPEGAEPGGAGILGAGGPSDFVVTRFVEANNWTGTIRNAPTPRNPDPNPLPRSVSLGFKKVPAPHWRWRGGDKEIEVRTFTFPQGTFEVTAFEHEGNRLAFTVTRPNGDTSCKLTGEPDGVYRGTCVVGANNSLIIDLKPPEAQNPASPAGPTAPSTFPIK
jgi:hypothetical protein